MWAFLSDAAVDRERSQECQQHENYRRHWRESPGGEEGDARLVAERGKVVHAGQAHYFVPGVMAMDVLLALEGPINFLDVALKQPAPERTHLQLRPHRLRRLCSRNHRPPLPCSTLFNCLNCICHSTSSLSATELSGDDCYIINGLQRAIFQE